MTQIPPTTAIDIDADDNCPECDAALEMVSPPHGYECRDCGREYHLEPESETETDGDADDTDRCETVMNSGDVCGRELPCPYHD